MGDRETLYLDIQNHQGCVRYSDVRQPPISKSTENPGRMCSWVEQRLRHQRANAKAAFIWQLCILKKWYRGERESCSYNLTAARLLCAKWPLKTGTGLGVQVVDLQMYLKINIKCICMLPLLSLLCQKKNMIL